MRSRSLIRCSESNAERLALKATKSTKCSNGLSFLCLLVAKNSVNLLPQLYARQEPLKSLSLFPLLLSWSASQAASVRREIVFSSSIISPDTGSILYLCDRQNPVFRSPP